MKHRDPDSTPDPQAVGQSVRIILDAFLHTCASRGVDPRFSERIETLAANLALWGSRMNLTAHPDDPEEIAFHVIDSLMPVIIAADGKGELLADAFVDGRSVLDLGSGAGFPGLVLAAASSATVTLVESRRKRASFLQVAAAEMGLSNALVEPTHADASSFHREFDLVTTRALGDSAEFFEIASAALKPGGVAMLYANPSQRLGLERARERHLLHYTRIAYVVARRDQRVERILALWRRSQNS